MNEENVNHEAAENEAKIKKRFEKLKSSRAQAQNVISDLEHPLVLH